MNKPTMVRVWAYTYSGPYGDRFINYYTRDEARRRRKRDKYVNGLRVGPITRVEIPAPSEVNK